jgi:hypothetical protein
MLLAPQGFDGLDVSPTRVAQAAQNSKKAGSKRARRARMAKKKRRRGKARRRLRRGKRLRGKRARRAARRRARRARRLQGQRGASPDASQGSAQTGSVLSDLQTHGTNFESIDDSTELKTTQERGSAFEARETDTASAGSVGIGTLGGGASTEGSSLVRSEVQVEGKSKRRDQIPQAILRNVLGKAERRIQLCYEQEVVYNSELGGRIAAELTVLPTGAIPNARISESTVGSQAVEKCIIKVVKSLSFPRDATEAPTTVTYFWRFQAPDG